MIHIVFIRCMPAGWTRVLNSGVDVADCVIQANEWREFIGMTKARAPVTPDTARFLIVKVYR
jgi:hypothetical protein